MKQTAELEGRLEAVKAAAVKAEESGSISDSSEISSMVEQMKAVLMTEAKGISSSMGDLLRTTNNQLASKAANVVSSEQLATLFGMASNALESIEALMAVEEDSYTVPAETMDQVRSCLEDVTRFITADGEVLIERAEGAGAGAGKKVGFQ